MTKVKAEVINFKEKRAEEIERRRRSFERVMFDNNIVCYSVIDANGAIYQIELIDISYDGCLFQVPWTKNSSEVFPVDEEMDLRLYFTKNSFIPVSVLIKYCNEFTDSKGTAYLRFGCEFDKSTQSFDALDAFVNFIYKFSEHSCIDKGDKKVFFL